MGLNFPLIVGLVILIVAAWFVTLAVIVDIRTYLDLQRRLKKERRQKEAEG